MSAQSIRPSRGEVWLTSLDPVEGHEQGGRRPCLIISDDLLNHGPSGLVMVVPITSTRRAGTIRVPIDPPEGGLKTRSYSLPEMLRSISVNRLHSRWGAITAARMGEVEEVVRALLRL